MPLFVWTRMQGQAGQTLAATIERKEAERLQGKGVFWWGIGNSIPDIPDKALAAGGELPVLFSVMRSKPAERDLSPTDVFLWTAWKDEKGVHEIPSHIVCLSRTPKRRYALV